VSRGGYDVVVRVAPNRATTSNRISVSLSRDGGPVAGAHVGVSAGMLTMAMGVGRYTLTGSSTYRAELPAWQMPGRWGLVLTVKPPGAAPVRVVLDDAIRR
jgi:hypothetical protein